MRTAAALLLLFALGMVLLAWRSYSQAYEAHAVAVARDVAVRAQADELIMLRHQRTTSPLAISGHDLINRVHDAARSAGIERRRLRDIRQHLHTQPEARPVVSVTANDMSMRELGHFLRAITQPSESGAQESGLTLRSITMSPSRTHSTESHVWTVTMEISG